MIRINEDWVVDVDPYNYILKKDMHRTAIRKKKDSKITEPVYAVQGYFSSLDKALDRVGEEILRDRLSDGDMTLIEAVTAIRECREEWRRLVEAVTKE